MNLFKTFKKSMVSPSQAVKDQAIKKISEFIDRTSFYPTDIRMNAGQFEALTEGEPVISYFRGLEIKLHKNPEIEVCGYQNQITLSQKRGDEYKEIRVFDKNPTVKFENGAIKITSQEELFIGSINDYSVHSKKIWIE
jgi:hypothetical protein